ncbi:MAG: chorismate synthase [Armatimonadetes bacterium]|nr:chorismate synthase [Armatimonadota bacterium]
MASALQVLTSGESHGPGLTAIVQGLPAGLPVDLDAIDAQLRRRQGGYGRGARQLIETDRVDILSGVRFGRTLGSPVTLQVPNKDFANWGDRMSVGPVGSEPPPIVEARPGHADFAGMLKYGTGDLRDILERSSARNTVALVAAGALCRQYLAQLGVTVLSHVVVLGGVHGRAGEVDDYAELAHAAEASPVRCADAVAEAAMLAAIDAAGARGDTLGGVFEVVAVGCPPGLGSHIQWDSRLDSRLAAAIMGIQAIKGVEIGMGFGVAEAPGSQVHDELFHDAGSGYTRGSNRAGGLEGGMTNGEPVVVRGAMKPISTMKAPLRSVNMASLEPSVAHFERSDVCAVPAAGVIAEAMVSIVLAEACVAKFAGDGMRECLRNHAGYLAEIAERGYVR